ncbi:RNA polymerase sigma factor [Anaerobranca gottschalkii]|uniref:RNA polymerase sigma factor n=1 Tax=Anaerobranca gottschalkii DSM 13577 TaxID=1120990 RepID=A0A1I0BG30_9FIRM|nr:RNA polymerase sigma factor [Anaerobranca gottschalkii]SET05848.1 RNA polymerase sigma-70 factor, ECF subfamily [Anaerobranca gottschalkii DSM 13577]
MDLLIIQCQMGDMEAFNKLIENYKNIALKMAYGLTGSIHEAEDLIQEAFLRVFKYIKNYKGDSNFTTWLYQIILNVYRDSYKKTQKVILVSWDNVCDKIKNLSCPSVDLELKELQASLVQQLEKLPKLTQKAILLKDYYGFSYEEISNILQCSIDSVKTRLYRGRKYLQEALRF